MCIGILSTPLLFLSHTHHWHLSNGAMETGNSTAATICMQQLITMMIMKVVTLPPMMFQLTPLEESPSNKYLPPYPTNQPVNDDVINGADDDTNAANGTRAAYEDADSTNSIRNNWTMPFHWDLQQQFSIHQPYNCCSFHSSCSPEPTTKPSPEALSTTTLPKIPLSHCPYLTLPNIHTSCYFTAALLHLPRIIIGHPKPGEIPTSLCTNDPMPPIPAL